MAVYPEVCGSGEDMKVDGKVGVGSSVPSDKLEVKGGSFAIEQSGDTNPTFQVLNYAHDNVAVNFDCYYRSGGWKSSDSGSNFHIYKISDKLRITYASGVAAGSTISDWSYPGTNSAIVIDKNGKVGIGTENPASRLHVEGDIELTDGCIKFDPMNPGGVSANCLYVDSGTNKIRFKDNTGTSHDLY